MTLFFDPRGTASLRDNDLLDLELAAGAHLPWLRDVLGEVQYLRNTFLGEEEAEATKGIEYQNDRIEYLTRVLDKLGATYDPE